jgi:DNA helicase-2/ATP-dependent DNA helicase PcrA
VSANPAYLDQLNPRQRQAVEHGVLADGSHSAAPLLVAAGAGSGKTNILAHRVAHLIVKGAEPHGKALRGTAMCQGMNMPLL